MVKKIVENQPDIVLIEKNASQLVKDLLLENNISLLVNVPLKILKKISKYFL
jgi:hypothetical protein